MNQTRVKFHYNPHIIWDCIPSPISNNQAGALEHCSLTWGDKNKKHFKLLRVLEGLFHLLTTVCYDHFQQNIPVELLVTHHFDLHSLKPTAKGQSHTKMFEKKTFTSICRGSISACFQGLNLSYLWDPWKMVLPNYMAYIHIHVL